MTITASFSELMVQDAPTCQIEYTDTSTTTNGRIGCWDWTFPVEGTIISNTAKDEQGPHIVEYSGAGPWDVTLKAGLEGSSCCIADCAATEWSVSIDISGFNSCRDGQPCSLDVSNIITQRKFSAELWGLSPFGGGWTNHQTQLSACSNRAVIYNRYILCTDPIQIAFQLIYKEGPVFFGSANEWELRWGPIDLPASSLVLGTAVEIPFTEKIDWQSEFCLPSVIGSAFLLPT